MKIIAETASNHMGEIEYLKELSLECSRAGAHMITVQVLNLDSFVTKYDKKSYSNFLKVHIAADVWIEYFDWCKEKKICILPCILDYPSAKLCFDYGFDTVKIHASDIINHDFLSYVNQSFGKVFLEFGGANLNEISSALKILDNCEVILLYGFNAYPTKIENQNLNFLKSLENLFDCKTGFADHSIDNDIIPLLAMAKGAIFLEKHVTIDSKNENRFDWQVSIEPNSLKKLIEKIDYYRPALGEPLRQISESEKNFRKFVYKKIIAKKDLFSGKILKEDDFEIKRSIDGLESSQIDLIIGNKLIKDVNKGNPIFISNIKKN